MSEEEKEATKASCKTNLTLYSEYNKTLRSWFVAFGIAVPAIFITSKEAKDFLLQSQDIKYIILYFLASVFFQILISFLNKYISWSTYHRDECKLRDKPCTKWYEYFSSHENKIWIDISLDITTFICFAMAILELLTLPTVG